MMSALDMKEYTPDLHRRREYSPCVIATWLGATMRPERTNNHQTHGYIAKRQKLHSLTDSTFAPCQPKGIPVF